MYVCLVCSGPLTGIRHAKNACWHPKSGCLRADALAYFVCLGAVPKEFKISCQPPYVRHYLYLRPQMAAKIAALQLIRQPLGWLKLRELGNWKRIWVPKRFPLVFRRRIALHLFCYKFHSFQGQILCHLDRNNTGGPNVP